MIPRESLVGFIIQFAFVSIRFVLLSPLSIFFGSSLFARYEPAGAGAISTGMWGAGTKGIPITTSVEQLETLPWATRYLRCSKEFSQCKAHRYEAKCWIERPDVVPPTKQSGKPGGQASWHPGNRE